MASSTTPQATSAPSARTNNTNTRAQITYNATCACTMSIKTVMTPNSAKSCPRGPKVVTEAAGEGVGQPGNLAYYNDFFCLFFSFSEVY
jgi:hypothetical protein